MAYFTQIVTVSTVCLALVIRRIFVVPKELAHLPRVSVWALLKSYLSGEEESQRVQRLLLPYGNEKKEQLVLVWTFGIWVIHVLDPVIGKQALRDRDWVRELPPQDLLLWKFVGRHNLAFTIGDEWKKHSRVITHAFRGPPKLREFSGVFKRLKEHMKVGESLVEWNTWTTRIALDILGVALLGHDFEAISDPDSVFNSRYRYTMANLTAPPYVFLPILDKLFPRKELVKNVEYLRGHFQSVIDSKSQGGSQVGAGLIGRMLGSEDFDKDDVLDNVSVLFIAGHETTAGGLSSVVYYLAKNEGYQNQAREEVDRIFSESEDGELTVEMLEGMIFVTACVQEAMRMNNPSNFTLPRISQSPKKLGHYDIPPGIRMCYNISAAHHLSKDWDDHEDFLPHRYLKIKAKDEKDAQANLNDSSFFGSGLRQCPARHFAMWELRAMLALLLRTYTWKLPQGSVHESRIHNSFSFGTNLNLPKDLLVDFAYR